MKEINFQLKMTPGSHTQGTSQLLTCMKYFLYTRIFFHSYIVYNFYCLPFICPVACGPINPADTYVLVESMIWKTRCKDTSSSIQTNEK